MMITMVEMNEADRALFISRKIVPFEQEIRDVFAAAERLHRAYSASAAYGGNDRTRAEISDCEHEYDRRRRVLYDMRDRPSWQEKMRRTDAQYGRG